MEPAGVVAAEGPEQLLSRVQEMQEELESAVRDARSEAERALGRLADYVGGFVKEPFKYFIHLDPP